MSSVAKKKVLTPAQAFGRLKKYCAYQERSHNETRSKLLQLGVYGNDLENVMVRLIEEGYLNEERFAMAFAGGKFRMKHWGKNKIEQELKRKGISAYNIRKAMKELPGEDYRKSLLSLMKRKAASLKDKNIFTRKQKLSNFLIRKGYEPELVFSEVSKFYHDNSGGEEIT